MRVPLFLIIIVDALTLVSLANGNRHEDVDVNVIDGFQKVGTRYYYFGEKVVTWYEAEQQCALLKSTLLSIETKEEQKALLDAIKRQKTDENAAYWTSGIDYIGKETHRWHWTGSGKDIEKFTNWCPNEPNNYDGNEHCLYLGRWGDNLCWNDISCTANACPGAGCYPPRQNISYICEKRVAIVNKPHNNNIRCSWECTTPPIEEC